MNTPRENLIVEAMGALGGAQKVDDLADAAVALTDAMGLTRYVVIDVRDTDIVGLHHNAPSELRTQIRVNDDPVAGRARSSRIPFAWQAGTGGAWRDKNGDAGYRSGVVGTWRDGASTECTVMLSCADEAISSEHGTTLLTYALMAAMTIGSTLKRLVPSQKAPCPFTARELDCLLYALAGRSSKEAARALGIEARTVRQYLERARARLGVSSSYAAATTALRRGWLDMQRASELAGAATSAG